MKKYDNNRNLKPKDFEVSQQAIDAYLKYKNTNQDWHLHLKEILGIERDYQEKKQLYGFVISFIVLVSSLLFFFIIPSKSCEELKNYANQIEIYRNNLKNSMNSTNDEIEQNSLVAVDQFLKMREDSLRSHYEKCDFSKIENYKHFIDSLLVARNLTPLKN